MEPIVVLGAGSWGTALALHLARNQNRVWLWTHEKPVFEQMQKERENITYLPGFKLHDNIEPMHDLSAMFAQLAKCSKQDLLMVVPSFAFEEVLKKVKLLSTPKTRMLWATKGVSEKGELLHELVEGQFSTYGLISGPSFAKEVAANMPTSVSLATNDAAFTNDMLKRFHNPEFRVYTSNDIIGLELGGTIKNVIAISVGLAEGLGFGMNAKAALMTRGLAELRKLAIVMGAQSETVMGLSGMGDMVLTCSDNQSRNRRFGLYLAEGNDVAVAEMRVGQVVEGKRNAEQAVDLFKKYDITAPICEMIFEIIYHAKDPRSAILQLLTQPPTDEF